MRGNQVGLVSQIPPRHGRESAKTEQKPSGARFNPPEIGVRKRFLRRNHNSISSMNNKIGRKSFFRSSRHHSGLSWLCRSDEHHRWCVYGKQSFRLIDVVEDEKAHQSCRRLHNFSIRAFWRVKEPSKHIRFTANWADGCSSCNMLSSSLFSCQSCPICGVETSERLENSLCLAVWSRYVSWDHKGSKIWGKGWIGFR